MILFLSFVRVNLASVSLHYHPLTVCCQLRSSGLLILLKAQPVDFFFFFNLVTLLWSYYKSFGLKQLIKSPKIYMKRKCRKYGLWKHKSNSDQRDRICELLNEIQMHTYIPYAGIYIGPSELTPTFPHWPYANSQYCGSPSFTGILFVLFKAK